MIAAAALVAAPLLTACEPTPTDAPTPIAGRLPSLSGVVVERTSVGVRPSASAAVDAWVRLDGYAFQHSSLGVRAVTDAQGRYRLSDLPIGADVQLRIWKGGFAHQCAAGLTVTEDVTLDTELVSHVILSASPSSVPSPQPGARLVSGVVYQETSSGRVPLPSASVLFMVDPAADIDAAETRADSQGRYLLCGLPKGADVFLLAIAEGRVAWRTVPPGESTDRADIVFGPVPEGRN